jgi:hypothetical protein
VEQRQSGIPEHFETLSAEDIRRHLEGARGILDHERIKAEWERFSDMNCPSCGGSVSPVPTRHLNQLFSRGGIKHVASCVACGWRED